MDSCSLISEILKTIEDEFVRKESYSEEVKNAKDRLMKEIIVSILCPLLIWEELQVKHCKLVHVTMRTCQTAVIGVLNAS